MVRLEVRVCAARNIAETQKVGSLDPYVKLKIKQQAKTQLKFKTCSVKKSRNPVWNELFKFEIADCDTTQIVFEVWNDNVMKDDLLGTYFLFVDGLERGVVKDMWVILSGSKKSTPELHLRVLAVDFGRPPAPGTATVTTLQNDRLTDAHHAGRKRHPSVSPHASRDSGVPSSVHAPQAPMNGGQQPQGFVPASQPYYAPSPHGDAVYGVPQPMYNTPQPTYGAPQPVYGVPEPMYGAPPPPPQPMYHAPPPPPVHNTPPPQPVRSAPPQQPVHEPRIQRSHVNAFAVGMILGSRRGRRMRRC